MIKDVEYEYFIVRTAQKIVDLGIDGVDQHIKEAQEKSMMRGVHPNAYMQISKSDFKSAQILTSAGLGHSVLKRMGTWQIDKFTYFTKSDKWCKAGGKSYHSKSLESFISKIISNEYK